jgi:hypothetical protein
MPASLIRISHEWLQEVVRVGDRPAAKAVLEILPMSEPSLKGQKVLQQVTLKWGDALTSVCRF